MDWISITRNAWVRHIGAILVIFFAVFMRWAFFADLGRGIPYLTVYPAVMLAALLGGLTAGLLGTCISALLCYYWILKGSMSYIEWLSFGVFCLSCAIISWICELMLRSRVRAKQSSEQLRHEITERMRVEEALRERVKELNCLYSIADFIEQTGSIGELLQKVADIMPHSWFYPELACARITYGDQEFKSENFKETSWKISADIMLLGKPVGTVEVRYLKQMPERDEGPFLKEERVLLNTVAERLGRVLERKQAEETIKELSLRDLLTTLYNRRGFITLAEQQLKSANRERRQLRLTFLDCDGLKLINDVFGHLEGDNVLVDTAEILRQTFRESDIIARLGGDEFGVLSINNPESDIFSDRINQNIEKFNAQASRPYRLAMSWGTAIYNPESRMSLDELMSEADRLMYIHKKTKAATDTRLA
ncbi:MAG: GGDEF domain-containing protein [Syntrophales bacterium LBB04]|nr:GGDEF domain-containing protein [Syntrophales bacterium LBB04]